MNLLREYIKELIAHGDKKYYFAYGSNMDQSRLHRRSEKGLPCVFDTHLNLPVIGNANLYDHSLGFAGYSETWEGPTATLVHNPGNKVTGVVYLTDEKQERALSCFENSDGHRTAPTHDKINVTVECDDGNTYECYTFVSKAKSTPESRPPLKYAKALKDAYASRGMI